MEIKSKENEMTEKKEVPEKYIFKLFISTKSSDSGYAVKNIQKFCNQYLSGRFELDIIDIYQMPDEVLEEQIILTPLLIKKFPLPEERISGDLSNVQNILSKFHID